ncbi:chloride channel protein [Vagococcus sp. BWB3-3]|uniref:Chloride channel protein n=1 Tax=Vagococcus allomyrinae TaxID=2794353 RepID=A0A940PHC7_9ENTE|nr:chloride channel protein [Vagococcus allomyrinae]MBP1043581.1 chloride channel protein [Vagococcus allomyrinae]
MSKLALSIRIAIYGIFLSTLIGAISFSFIYLESNVSHHLWHLLLNNQTFKPFIILLYCLLGGLIVGSLRARWGDYPQTAHQIIHQLKAQQTVNYRPVFKSLTVALLILIFGAGVGPEAALLGAIVMLSVWQADKLRYLVYHQESFVALRPLQRLKHMLHPTRYLSTYDPNFANKKLVLIKKFIIFLFIINGLLAFISLMKRTNQPSFISNMGQTQWQLTDLWLFFPLIVLGILAGKLYHLFQKKMATWLSFWPDQPIKKALLGSLAIFIIGTFTPNLLFSGQVTLGTVPTEFGQFSVLQLLLVVSLKLIFLQICLHTGWIGGDIFPIVFSAIILGFGTSQLLPNVDTTFIVATVATAMAGSILNSPLGVAIFISLFFPVQILPVTLLTGLLLQVIQNKRKQIE